MTTIKDVAPMFSAELSEKLQRICDSTLVPLTIESTADNGRITESIVWRNVRHHIKTLWRPVWFGEELYIHDPCLNYYRHDNGDIINCIQACLQVRGFDVKPKAISDAIDLICNHVSVYPFGHTTGYLNFVNGILDATTQKFVESNDSIMFDYVVATPYVECKDTPELDAFLSIYGTAGREAIPTLAKCLWQRCHLHPIKEITVWYGKKDSGKTTLAEFIQATLDGDLLSQKNTSREVLNELLQRFGYAPLEHKLFNLGDDLPDTFIKNASALNKFVGTVHHSIEHKGVDKYDGVITAYNLFTTNNLPPLDDDDFVLWSKIRLVRFEADFKRGTLVEYSVIIRMQLLYRAVQMMLSWKVKPYANDQSPEEVRTIWHEASTDVDLFMTTRLIFDGLTVTPLESIKKEYERWCAANGKHIHIKFLMKRLQPYLRRSTSGNGYAVRITTEVEAGDIFQTKGQEILPTT